ncbi:MAG: hypothetical protein H0V17_19140 [Deltaproteobacteria bacterium]|nr:hypothetical protein [Deltaproteobacteria bacterium]
MAAFIVSTNAHESTADPKREVPDYDGRGNEDTEAGSWALWIPRIALSPLYLINEFVLRRPLGALVTTAERRRWANAVIDIFTFGPGGKSTIVPTALFDFGLLPSVGIYLASDDFLTPGNTFRFHVGTWGPDWINVTVRERYTWNEGQTTVGARFDFKRQADQLFFGTGPDVTTATRARYGLQRTEAGGTFLQRLGGESTVEASSGVRRIKYRAGDCCNDPSLDSRIADGTLEIPDGYDTPYTSFYQKVNLTLDTRAPRPANSSGGYLQMHAETNFDTRNDRSWVDYGATFGVAADLHRQRTLRGQVAVNYVDPLEGGEVPFNELASLGGNLMPGFVSGWMLGRSVIAAQLAYTWPVWMWLDAQLRFSIGNAFDSHLGGLAANKLRLSGDVGITTIGKRDQRFEILFGLGTETFEQGAGITSVRLSIGSRKGF